MRRFRWGSDARERSAHRGGSASPSTRSYDLIEKRAVYRQIASIETYVVVHTSSRTIEIDLRDPDGIWRTIRFEDDGVPLGNGMLALDDVYRRSSLEAT